MHAEGLLWQHYRCAKCHLRTCACTSGPPHRSNPRCMAPVQRLLHADARHRHVRPHSCEAICYSMASSLNTWKMFEGSLSICSGVNTVPQGSANYTGGQAPAHSSCMHNHKIAGNPPNTGMPGCGAACTHGDRLNGELM